MEIRIEYYGLEDREVKIKEQESKGLRMLHDDFDPSWKPGDEPYGVMTFTDVIEPILIPNEPVRDYGREIDEIKAMINEIKTKLKAMGIAGF